MDLLLIIFLLRTEAGVGPLLLATPSFVGWLIHWLLVRWLGDRSPGRSFGCSFVRLLIDWLLVCWLLTCLAARVFDYSCVWLLVLFAARSFAARPSGCTFVGLLDLPVAH